MANRAVIMSKPRLVKIADTITVDSCLDESHNMHNTVTDHPVEQGFNVSDHCRPDPERVTLRCFVSNTPLSTEQKTRAVSEGALRFETTAQEAVAIGAVDGRGDQTYRKLKKLRDEGTLCKLATTLKTYQASATEGMIIEDITIPRTAQNYDGLEFTVVFKQIRIVRNKQTRDTQPKDKRTGGKKKQGNQTTKPEPEDKRSLAARTADSAAQSSNGTWSGVGKAAGGH